MFIFKADFSLQLKQPKLHSTNNKAASYDTNLIRTPTHFKKTCPQDYHIIKPHKNKTTIYFRKLVKQKSSKSTQLYKILSTRHKLKSKSFNNNKNSDTGL